MFSLAQLSKQASQPWQPTLPLLVLGACGPRRVYETNTLDDVCIAIDRDRHKAQGIGSQFRRYSMYSVPMYQLDFQHAYYANAIYMIT